MHLMCYPRDNTQDVGCYYSDGIYHPPSWRIKVCNSTLKALSGSVEKNTLLELASLRYHPEHLVMDSL